MREEATRVLPARREDVWALVSQPYHLSDWWPGYTGVESDRRGLAEGARWTVVRSARPGFLRKPHGGALILVSRVAVGTELAWHDLAQRLDMGISLENEGGKTRATTWVAGAWWRLFAEGARSLPTHALARLHDLCQTASRL